MTLTTGRINGIKRKSGLFVPDGDASEGIRRAARGRATQTDQAASVTPGIRARRDGLPQVQEERTVRSSSVQIRSQRNTPSKRPYRRPFPGWSGEGDHSPERVKTGAAPYQIKRQEWTESMTERKEEKKEESRDMIYLQETMER